MIYTAPYLMFLIRADPLRGQVGRGWALEIETFLGPMKWHRAVRRVPFGVQKIKSSWLCVWRESEREGGRGGCTCIVHSVCLRAYTAAIIVTSHTQKNFRNACYQVGFCTGFISTGVIQIL